MLNRLLAPLRRTVGQPLYIDQADVVTRSTELQLAAVDITLDVYDSLGEITSSSYQDVLPDELAVGPNAPALRPVAEAAVLPRPADLPFDASDASFLSLKALARGDVQTASRALWFEVRVRFGGEVLLGGVCYGGYPFLPYYVSLQGENSSNFGLPRELRLRWKARDVGFIDDETAVTVQEATSHSGVHYFCTGPVKTDWVILRFSDLPKLLKKIEIGEGEQVSGLDERYGLLIPYLYFFSYREGTRFRPRVPAGLLAALKSKRQSGAPQPPARLRPSADFNYQAGDSFVPLSAASMFDGRRSYQVANGPLDECFCSSPLAPQDALELYVEQAEEEPRCVAGVRLKFRALNLPGVRPRTDARLKVYELDPPEGVSPLNAISEKNKKYSVTLFDGAVTPSQDSIVCKFVRPSSARYFVLIFTNVGSQSGQIAIERAELVQSAHVSVVPRPSRAQTVSNLHYRIIGPGLADDYALLGYEGFSLNVERLVAGERKAVLFSAASLLDLLQAGGARLYANQRYLQTSTYEERTETLPGGHDEHFVRAWSDGWRRSESGQGVADQWGALNSSWGSADYPWKGESAATSTHNPTDDHGFNTFANSESRSRVELIGHESMQTWSDELRRLINDITGSNLLPPLTRSRLLEGGGGSLNWEQAIWKGMASGIDLVGAVSNLNVPPGFLFPKEAINEVRGALKALADWINNPALVPDGPSLNRLAAFFAWPQVLNGLGAGVSGSGSWGVVGGSLSFSCGQVFPQLTYNSSEGTTGSINKQASLTGYSYNQALHKGFDQTRVRTEFRSGLAARTVTRSERRDEGNRERARGVEVQWHDSFVDIIAGTIPIGITLPATASQSYRTADETLLVRLGSGAGAHVQVDVWFEVLEEVVRDDY